MNHATPFIQKEGFAMFDPDLIEPDENHSARIIDLRPRSAVYRQITQGNTTGSVVSDFMAMWRLPAYVMHVNWFRVARGALAVVGFFALAKAALSLI